MVAVALKCPFCGSEDVSPYGTSNSKKRYACNEPPHRRGVNKFVRKICGGVLDS
jgi:hypothetical protein